MEKIKIDFVLTCDQVIISKDGKGSIINIFNEIAADNFPAMHPAFCVLTKTTGEAGDYKIEISLKNQQKNSIADVEGRLIISASGKGTGSNYFSASFVGVSFEEGEYSVEVSVFDNSKALDNNGCSILVRRN